MRRLESRVGELSARKAELEATLADPVLYQEASGERLEALLVERGQVESRLEEAETGWLAKAADLESAATE